jgi:hypothetical protein
MIAHSFGLCGAMPIKVLLDADPDHFRPDDIEKIVAGFEAALAALHITDGKDAKALTVAKIIFEAAKQGELDPERLRDIAVKALSK